MKKIILLLLILFCGAAYGNTTLVPTPKVPPGIPTHFADRAAQGDIDVVWFGDSIAEQVGYYTELWGVDYYPNETAVDFGVGGDRIENILWRVENGDADGYDARIIILPAGTNNIGINTDSEIVEGIENLIMVLQAHQPNAKIIVNGIPPNINGCRYAVNGPLKTWTETEDNVYFFDLCPVWTDDGVIKTDPPVLADSLHPNEYGCTLWVEAMDLTILNLLGYTTGTYATGDVPIYLHSPEPFEPPEEPPPTGDNFFIGYTEDPDGPATDPGNYVKALNNTDYVTAPYSGTAVAMWVYIAEQDFPYWSKTLDLGFYNAYGVLADHVLFSDPSSFGWQRVALNGNTHIAQGNIYKPAVAASTGGGRVQVHVGTSGDVVYRTGSTLPDPAMTMYNSTYVPAIYIEVEPD